MHRIGCRFRGPGTQTGPVLLLKVLLAPALVVATSLAGRRWGPQVAGVLVTLPIVAGPILVVLYLEQGAAFAARATTTALLGIVALGAFGVVFAAVARRYPWAVTLGLSWVAVLAVDLALFRVRLPAAVAWCWPSRRSRAEPLCCAAGSRRAFRRPGPSPGGICRRVLGPPPPWCSP